MPAGLPATTAPETAQPAVEGPQLTTAAPQPGLLTNIFRGPNGLRALWRLLIFVGILASVRFPLNAILHRVFGHHPEFTAKTVLIGESLAFALVVIATAIMGHFEKRTFADYGLPARGAFGGRFFEGIVWGFLAECATLGILYLSGNASFAGLDQRGAAALRYGLLWGAAFILVGFFEEFLFRGYPQFTLATGIGFWPAAFLLSGLFWLGHMGNPGETWVGGLATAIAALIFCVSLRLTGNLWFAIGMHAGWDWTETYFFGVADSGFPANGHLLNTTLTGSKWMTGGTVGPEGSVVELVVCLAVIALLFARFRKPARRDAWSPAQPNEQVA
jgi:membrane protease YdiL (CAAX protease family)